MQAMDEENTKLPDLASSGSSVSSFVPLYGVDADDPFCYLLRIDNVHILLDCGWDQRWDENMLQPLKEVVPDIDAVLISHPDVAHLGALPYAVGKLGLSAPIYCTVPVHKMGQMYMYDSFMSLDFFDFKTFDLNDVDAAFEKCHKLKYQQEINLSEGITIVPYRAGHMIGGTVWKIQKETESIIYAVDFNHKKEHHLDGFDYDDDNLSRPTVLITDSHSALSPNVPKDRNSRFVEAIIKTVRGYGGKDPGNVLLPVDSAGRVLEVLLILQKYWQSKQLKTTYSLAFLSNQSKTTIDFARSQLEWLSESCNKNYNENRVNPFTLPDVVRCRTLEELKQLPEPYICFASNFTLGTGFGQSLFLELTSSPSNLILFTQRAPSYTLASQLMQQPTPSFVEFQERQKVLLKGEELEDYERKLNMEREMLQLEAKGEQEESSDSDDDAEMKDLSANASRAQQARKRKRMALASYYPMFPAKDVHRSWDEYGELIDVEEMRALKTEFELRTSDSYNRSSSSMSAMDVVDETKEEEEDEEDMLSTVMNQGPPMKTIFSKQVIPVNCRVKYLDFEGRTDGDSLKHILKSIAPRKVILVHGSPEESKALARFCLTGLKSVCEKVVLPRPNQCIDITSDRDVVRVNLKEGFIDSLNFVEVGEYGLAYADGEVRIDYKDSPFPILGTAPPEKVQGHPAVFLGDVKFSDVKKTLNQAGIEAEFSGGVVVCAGGMVRIKKVSKTRISLSGALSAEYFQIRQLLYGKYQIL